MNNVTEFGALVLSLLELGSDAEDRESLFDTLTAEAVRLNLGTRATMGGFTATLPPRDQPETVAIHLHDGMVIRVFRDTFEPIHYLVCDTTPDALEPGELTDTPTGIVPRRLVNGATQMYKPELLDTEQEAEFVRQLSDIARRCAAESN